VETINQFVLSWVQATIERDPSKLVNVTNNRLASETKTLEDMKRSDKFYRGKLVKIVYDLDSINIVQKDGKYYATVDNSQFHEGTFYYKNGTNVISPNNPIWRHSLVYDDTNNKWLVDSYSSLSFANFTKNTKEFSFEN